MNLQVCLEIKLGNALEKEKGRWQLIRPKSPAQGMTARALRWPSTAQGREADAQWQLCRKAPKLLDINTTTMRTILTISNFATKPSDIFIFTTGRSLETAHVPARRPMA